MAVAIEELEKLALELPEKQRAELAASLLDSLPGVLTDDDEGVSEALRRDRELESGHSSGLSIEQLDALIHSRR
jgi:putative addiction module component (TIGR02574 family)